MVGANYKTMYKFVFFLYINCIMYINIGNIGTKRKTRSNISRRTLLYKIKDLKRMTQTNPQFSTDFIKLSLRDSTSFLLFNP